MTKFLTHPQERVSGPFTVTVNGAQTSLRTGTSFTDTTALLAALDEAGIVYTAVPLTALTGTASGRIRIPGTGSSQFISLGGRVQNLALNTWFTPGTGVAEALDHAGIAYDTEYTDQTPDAFTFTDVTGVTTGSTQTSNTITVAGLDSGVSVAVTITGGTYSKNGGSYVSTAGTAVNGDTFAVRHTASGSSATAVNTVLTIGGVSDTFTSTTTASLTPGPDLITNGAFSVDANWTKAHIGGDSGLNPTISGGKANSTAGSDFSTQTLTQTLSGGSSVAGSYQLTTTTTGSGGGLTIRLLGAANELRGTSAVISAGVASQQTVVASGEVSKIEIRFNNRDGTADDVMLQLLS